MRRLIIIWCALLYLAVNSVSAQWIYKSPKPPIFDLNPVPLTMDEYQTLLKDIARTIEDKVVHAQKRAEKELEAAIAEQAQMDQAEPVEHEQSLRGHYLKTPEQAAEEDIIEPNFEEDVVTEEDTNEPESEAEDTEADSKLGVRRVGTHQFHGKALKEYIDEILKKPKANEKDHVKDMKVAEELLEFYKKGKPVSIFFSPRGARIILSKKDWEDDEEQEEDAYDDDNDDDGAGEADAPRRHQRTYRYGGSRRRRYGGRWGRRRYGGYYG